MRASLFTIGLLALFVTLAAAWSKEDQEIFRLRDEVEASEGEGVTFYDFIGAKPNVNQEDLNKAYKKKSRALHPDKAKRQFVADQTTGKDKKKSGKPGVNGSKGPSQKEIRAATKAASDRFARLGLVNSILKGSGRARYDHFLANGFPKWKGTGYYYARFRPGLGSVLFGLFVFVGGAGHYLALYMSWKRQQEFVGRYIKFARHAAWGDSLNIPGLDSSRPSTPPVATTADSEAQEEGRPIPRNRKERRMMEKDDRKVKPEKKIRSKAARAAASPAGTPTTTGPRKRVVAENGKVLVVDQAGNVYLEQKDEEGETQEFLLDPNELPPPTFKSTALYRAPIWAYNLTAGRFLNKPVAEDDEQLTEGEQEAEAAVEALEDSDDFELLEKSKSSEPNGNGSASKKSKKSKR